MGLGLDFSEFKNTMDKLISDTQKYRLTEENIFEVFDDAIWKANYVSGGISKDKFFIIFPEEKFNIMRNYLLKSLNLVENKTHLKDSSNGEMIILGFHIKSGIDEKRIKAHAAIEDCSEYVFCKEFNRIMKDYF